MEHTPAVAAGDHIAVHKPGDERDAVTGERFWRASDYSNNFLFEPV